MIYFKLKKISWAKIFVMNLQVLGDHIDFPTTLLHMDSCLRGRISFGVKTDDGCIHPRYLDWCNTFVEYLVYSSDPILWSHNRPTTATTIFGTSSTVDTCKHPKRVISLVCRAMLSFQPRSTRNQVVTGNESNYILVYVMVVLNITWILRFF